MSPAPSASPASALAPGLSGENPISRFLIHTSHHLPEIGAYLTDPTHLAVGAVSLAAGSAATYGTLHTGRKAARKLSARPGDIEIGQRRQSRSDYLIRPRLFSTFADRTRGSMVVGPPGSGKTTALLSQAIQDLACRHNVIVQEIYGDFGRRIVSYALAMGVPVLYFDTSAPEASLKWNPLRGEDDEQIVERAVATVRGMWEHEYFGGFNADFARNFLHLARQYARARGVEPDVELVKLLIEEDDLLNRVLQIKDVGGRPTATAPYLTKGLKKWFTTEYLQWPTNIRLNYASSFRIYMRDLLATKAARTMLCPAPGERVIDIAPILRMGGVLAVFRVPTQSVGASPASVISRWILKDIQDATLARDGFSEPVPPCALYLDELHTLLGAGRADDQANVNWFTLIRKQNVAWTVSFQGWSLLTGSVAETLDFSCGNQLYGGGMGPEDARKIQQTLGVEEKHHRTTSTSRGGMLGTPARTTVSTGTGMQSIPRFTVEDIRFLRRGNWLYVPTVRGDHRPGMKIYISKPPSPQKMATKRLSFSSTYQNHRSKTS